MPLDFNQVGLNSVRYSYYDSQIINILQTLKKEEPEMNLSTEEYRKSKDPRIHEALLKKLAKNKKEISNWKQFIPDTNPLLTFEEKLFDL